MPKEFTIDEARAVLAVIRDMAQGNLSLPLTDVDMAMILSVGVEIKDADLGLLDFPTLVDGISAYWCWRVGESEIEWWHPRDTGFAGRRRIENY